MLKAQTARQKILEAGIIKSSQHEIRVPEGKSSRM